MDLAEIPAIGIGFLGVGLVIIGLSVLGFIILPVLLFVAELIILLAIAAVVFPYRWLRGEHTVVARSDGKNELRWKAGSLREAKETTDWVAAQMKIGHDPSGQLPEPFVRRKLAG